MFEGGGKGCSEGGKGRGAYMTGCCCCRGKGTACREEEVFEEAELGGRGFDSGRF